MGGESSRQGYACSRVLAGEDGGGQRRRRTITEAHQSTHGGDREVTGSDAPAKESTAMGGSWEWSAELAEGDGS